MRVAVVGGAGYVGSVLCPMLAEDKNISDLCVVDTFWFWNHVGDYQDLFSEESFPKLDLRVWDMRDPMEDVLEGCDVVINLACLSNDISSDLDRNFTHSISYDGVMNVIKTCEKLDIKRIIQVSSGSVYGVQEKPVSEDTYPLPITQYAIIKMELDHYLQNLMNYEDYDITILRPATLYGVSPRQRIDLMVNIFARKIATGEPIVVHGGSQSRPALHVKDFSETIHQIVNNEKSYNQIYNVSKEAMTVLEYANLFKDIYPEAEIIIEDVVDQRSWRTNSEKLYRHLGIINKTKLKNGIKELVAKFSDPNFCDERTVNIQVVRGLLCH
tara:strand:- start:2734 stop:3714 length:981 start_codon:yes stop_codon:yes gene_type:complete